MNLDDKNFIQRQGFLIAILAIRVHLRSRTVNVDDGFDLGATEERGVVRPEQTIEEFGDGPRHDEEDDDEEPNEPVKPRGSQI